jgi:hypothetical protein
MCRREGPIRSCSYSYSYSMSILGVTGPSSGVEAEYEYEYEYEKTSVFARIPAPMGRGKPRRVVQGWRSGKAGRT